METILEESSLTGVNEAAQEISDSDRRNSNAMTIDTSSVKTNRNSN